MRRVLLFLPLLLALMIVFPAVASPAAQTTDCNSVTGIPASECQALMALYTSTNGPGWTTNTGWGTSNTPCSWYGVTCSGGHVTQLSLSSNGLSGSLPPELGSLADLRYLYLGFNQLSESIPPELGNLTSLRNLDLSFNGLSGSIPPELGNLTSLQVLLLDNNQLSGSLPPQLGSLTNLRYLFLVENQLSGSLPPELGNLASLLFLDLSNNQLSGSLPPELGNLANVQSLYLSNNQLSGSLPPELGNLASLQYLYLRYNMLTASDPALLAFLTSKDPNWANTQTVAPGSVQLAAFVPPNGVSLSWTPILYTGDGGYYLISYATAPGGPYTTAAQTADKAASSYTLTGLQYDTRYYLVVQSYTPAHGEQQNNLLSDYSPEISTIISSANAIPKRGHYTTSTPTLTWNRVHWAAGYEVQVAKNTSFLTNTLVYSKADVPADALSVTPDPLGNGTYYWRVRAIRANGAAGAWSAVDSFIVDAP